MVYAIISDIHANLEALERVLSDAADLGAGKVICLGDCVGYGPRPRETLALVRQTASLILAGNHDDAVCGRGDETDFIDLAGEAVLRHRAELTDADRAQLAELPYTARLGDVAFAHGDFTEPKLFNYIDSREDAAANFAATDAQILFVGHTHVPLLHIVGASGEIYSLAPQDFSAEDGKRYIVNVGSVGYPRECDGMCHSSYVLYDDETKSVRFRRLPFSVASVLQRGAPRRRRGRILIFVASLTLSAALTAVALLNLRRSDPEPTVVIAARTDEALQTKTVYFTPLKRTVHANLKLAKNSPAAHLTIIFVNEHQETVLTVDETVKASSRKGFSIPPTAVGAKLELRAATPGQSPVVARFDPVARSASSEGRSSR